MSIEEPYPKDKNSKIDTDKKKKYKKTNVAFNVDRLAEHFSAVRNCLLKFKDHGTD